MSAIWGRPASRGAKNISFGSEQFVRMVKRQYPGTFVPLHFPDI